MEDNNNGGHRGANKTTSRYPAQASGGANAGAGAWPPATHAALLAVARAIADLPGKNAIPNAALLAVARAIADLPGKNAIPDAGIRAGEIRAYRAWRVRGDRLFSVYMERFEWVPGVPAIGDVGIDLGVHGFKFVDQAGHYCQRRYQCMQTAAFNISNPGWTFAIGTVDLWGEVIEHERGYRAEFAAIASLDSLIGEGDLAALRARYGVETG